MSFLSSGPLPQADIPGTPQALQGLRERRDILRDQLEQAATRRSTQVDMLNQEGDNSLPREAREGIQRRIDLIDERILQLERDQALTEQLISNAPTEVLAASEAQTRAQQQLYQNNRIDEDEAAGIAFSTFGAGIVLTLLISRFRRTWRARRGGATTTAAAAVGVRDDPRIDRLTQTVEAIAEEVERIGEGQRFVTQLLANRPGSVLQGEPVAAGDQRR
ncbi:MAG TPA: hypothetical protein VE869_07100 [Gemmatimonas sp.]|nr:hypothetical protein [Gemmatimonas sp.]